MSKVGRKYLRTVAYQAVLGHGLGIIFILGGFFKGGERMPGLKVCSRLLIIVLAVAGAACANRPPVLNCVADPSTVTEGNQVVLQSNASDPDRNAKLSFSWSSEGGSLDTTQNSSAVFDSTGLAPDTYTVSLMVRDEMPGPPSSWLCYGQHSTSCEVDIAVEKNKLAPTVTCDPSSASVTEGDSRTLRARASDPNGDALTYGWTVDGQSVPNNNLSFEFGTTGRQPGNYVVRATVTDVDGLTASCEHSLTVTRKPNSNPDCGSLNLSRREAFAGESLTASLSASDPDGDRLSYSWSVDGGSRPATGSSLSINTTGFTGGSHTVTASARDDRGGTCSASSTFRVIEKTIVQMDGSRPDNVAKAQLDEIALKMEQNPRLRAVVTGHTDDRGSEKANERVGLRRAEALKAYLVKERGVDPDRIEATSAGESSPLADNTTSEGRKVNRRGEIELSIP